MKTKGFFVDFNDFDASRLCTSGAKDVDMPAGRGTAKQIEINYKYPIKGEKDVESKLVILCPAFTTSNGIQPSKYPKADGSRGTPAIRVNFDPVSPDHLKMLGSFGTKHDYETDDDGVTKRVNEKYEEASGVLGSIYDWCVNQYAKLLAEKSGKGVGIGHLLKASDPDSGIKKKEFAYEHKRDDVIAPVTYGKFLKLLDYRPGTPEENLAKFYLPNDTIVDNYRLYDQGFIFKPVLSFRRIFIGANGPSATMEVTQAMITDFLEKTKNISSSIRYMTDKFNESKPYAAAEIAAKYKALMSSDESELASKDLPQESSKLKIDIEEEDDSRAEFVDKSTFKPKLDSSDVEKSKAPLLIAKPRLPPSMLKSQNSKPID